MQERSGDHGSAASGLRAGGGPPRQAPPPLHSRSRCPGSESLAADMIFGPPATCPRPPGCGRAGAHPGPPRQAPAMLDGSCRDFAPTRAMIDGLRCAAMTLQGMIDGLRCAAIALQGMIDGLRCAAMTLQGMIDGLRCAATALQGVYRWLAVRRDDSARDNRWLAVRRAGTWSLAATTKDRGCRGGGAWRGGAPPARRLEAADRWSSVVSAWSLVTDRALADAMPPSGRFLAVTRDR
jgi:hypothetical protein